jgi:hypothetical protein
MSKLEKLQRRLLTKEEVRFLAEKLKQVMGAPFSEMLQRYGISPQDHFRFQPLAVRLESARIERGLSLKAAASVLNTAQYRLAAIENSRIRDIDGQLLVRYVEHLGLKSWFGRWKKSNSSLVQRLQIAGAGNLTAASRATRRKRRAPEAER